MPISLWAASAIIAGALVSTIAATTMAIRFGVTDRTGMLDPAEVAAAIYAAVEADEDELIIGDVAQKVHSALTAPVTALYPQLASR